MIPTRTYTYTYTRTPTQAYLLYNSRVIFWGERPILSLITSFRDGILVPGLTDSEKLGPIVGCIVTDRELDETLLSLRELEVELPLAAVALALPVGVGAVVSILKSVLQIQGLGTGAISW